jgi:hypothetical protein
MVASIAPANVPLAGLNAVEYAIGRRGLATPLQGGMSRTPATSRARS